MNKIRNREISRSKFAGATITYSGGAASVAAVAEIDGKNFRIEKTFLAQKSAKIVDCANGQVIKQ